MANPTSNFGWQMPTTTDLVTDLPADFEVFGQAVDSDFVDLLGGANGYILSKASATDLDFAWIPPITSYTINTQTGTTYTPVLSDNASIVTLNNASAISVTIPTNASVAYTIGSQLNFAWITGVGQPTISAVTPGTTTIISTAATPTAPKLRVENSMATCVKIATDKWLVIGDIA